MKVSYHKRLDWYLSVYGVKKVCVVKRTQYRSLFGFIREKEEVVLSLPERVTSGEALSFAESYINLVEEVNDKV